MLRNLVNALRAPQLWRTLLVMAVLFAASSEATLIRPQQVAEPLATQSAPIAEAITTDVHSFQEESLQVGRRQTVESNLFDELIQPFKDAALARRAERARSDSTYATRVDAELNATRINFLLFGYGETYEPPHAKDIIGTITILSLDYRTHRFAQISLTHDARAPEIERYLAKRGIVTNPSKIDQTYAIGGFDLMREAVEGASGLAIDFQVAVEDVVVKQLVDEVFGTIEVENPFELDTNPIYVQGVQHPGAHFSKGRLKFDGLLTLNYLKGLALPPYDPTKENNIRKQFVFRALSQHAQQNLTNPLAAFKALSFLRGELARKTIAYDFDISTLVINAMKKLASRPNGGALAIPSIDQNIYLVDQQFGDGGFTWVMGTQSAIIKDELKRGIYKDTAMVVPDGDPYAPNLAMGYWTSARRIVKSRLMPAYMPKQVSQLRCPTGDIANPRKWVSKFCQY